MSFEAFILLILPVATLNINRQSHFGTFELKCVSLTVEVGENMQENYPPSHQEIYLVVRVGGHDTPIDPSRPITFSYNNAGRSYVFGTADGGTGCLLLPTPAPSEAMVLEDQNTLHGIFAQYADLTEPASSVSQMGKVPDQTVSHEAARGRLVLVDDNTGEIVGELDHKLRINEDSSLGTPGGEGAPVVIEIADDDAQEVFARVIPPEERDWITNSASLVRYVLLPHIDGCLNTVLCSRVISGTTELLLTTITSAADYYIAHSTPRAPVASANGAPASTPPRALMFLTSENAQKGLSTVHALSVQAATISSKTVGLIDSMIKRAVRCKQKTTPAPVQSTPPRFSPHPPSSSASATSLKPPLPPRTPSPSSSTFSYSSHTKPPLPPRQGTPSNYSRTPSPQPAPMSGTSARGPPPSPLKTRHRLLLSADLILETMDSSVQRIVSVGGDNLARAVEHKCVPCSLMNKDMVLMCGLCGTDTARKLHVVLGLWSGQRRILLLCILT